MTTSLDGARVEAFREQLFGAYVGGMVTLMIDLASRTGLLDALATGPGTSEELASRSGLVERYVRECLGALVTAGIAGYDPATRQYSLPPEHALLLTGDGSLNMAPRSRFIALLGVHVPGVAGAFRTGGGVPYQAYRPGFTEVMDGRSRGLLDGQLLDGILPLTGELPARLTEGVRVAEIGCGTGHALNLMARAYPRSSFTGYDLAEDGIAQARAEAAAWGLTNASFEVLDVTRLPSDPPSTAGLGTGWGEQLARRVLDEAGFVDVSVPDVPDDPFDWVYVARTPHRVRWRPPRSAGAAPGSGCPPALSAPAGRRRAG